MDRCFTSIPLVIPCINIFYSLLGLAWASLKNGRSRRFATIVWSCAFGLSLGYAWITREESIWLVVAAVPVILLMAGRGFRAKAAFSLLSFAIMLLGFTVIYGTVALINYQLSTINYQHYGYPGIVDMKEKEFSRAWDGVLSLNTSQTAWNQHFTLETRDKLLLISPRTALLIKDRLNANGEYKRHPTGIGGGQGIWAMRSALKNNGYYRDFTRTQQHLSAIANDIESYCSTNADECTPPVLSKVLWKDSHADAVIPTSYEIFKKLVQYEYANYTPKNLSAGSIKGNQNFIDGLTSFFNLNLDN